MLEPSFTVPVVIKTVPMSPTPSLNCNFIEGGTVNIQTIQNKGSGQVNVLSVNIWSEKPMPRDPVGDRINTVKITEYNYIHLAQLVLNSGIPVHVDQENKSFSIVNGNGQSYDEIFLLGDWLIEGYDYRKSKTVYKVANLEEREKYGLR